MTRVCLPVLLALPQAGWAGETTPDSAEDETDGAGVEEQIDGQVIVWAKPLALQSFELDGDSLRLTPGMSAAEALESIPGVDAIRTAAGAPDPVLRGLSGERVRVRVGAVPIFGACPARMDPPLVYVLPQTGGPLRLDLGLGSLTDGPAGVGGRIQVRPDWAPPPGRPDGVVSEGALAFAANGLRTRLGASAELTEGPVDGRLAVDLGRGGDYRSGAGAEVPANHEHVGASLSLAGRPGAGHRLFAALSFVRETDVDHPALPMDNDLTDAWVANLGYRMAGDGAIRSIELGAGLSFIDHTMSNRGRPNRSILEAVTPSTSWTAGASGVIRLQVHEHMQLALGLDFYHLARDAERTRIVVASGARFQDHIWPDASEWDGGALAEWSWLVDPHWLLTLGGRVDLVGSGAAALDDPSLQGLSVREQFEQRYGPGAGRAERQNTVGAARLAVNWIPEERMSLFVALGTTGRAPSITERFFAFAPAPGGFRVGNPTLAPEQKLSLELGGRWRSRYLDADLTAFGYQVEDFILRTVLERADVNGDGIDDLIFGFENTRALLAGGEIALTPKPLGWLSLPLSLVSVTGWNLGQDRWLGEIPPLTGRAGVRVERRDGVRWWAEVSLRVAAAQTFVDERIGETRSPAHRVLDLRAGVDPWPWLRIRMGILNLTDAAYSPHLNRPLPMPAGDLPAGARLPAPGISGYLVASGRY